MNHSTYNTQYIPNNIHGPELSPGEIDVEIEKVIKQLEFATWMKALDDLIEIEQEIKKIEINHWCIYHRQ